MNVNGWKSRFLVLSGWVAMGLALGLAGPGCGPQGTGADPALRSPQERSTHAVANGPMCGGTDVHTKHVDQGVGCATCHPCGAVFGFDVPFTYPRGTTTAGGTLTRGIAPAVTTCTVACHSPMGAPAKSVAWNAGPRGCTDCHVASMLPAVHPALSASPTNADCLGCHTSTTSHTAGTVTLAGHPAAWTDQASPGFHALQANKGLGQCQGCHGADLTGGSTGFACALCHDTALPAGVASWKVNCVMCHGGTGNQTGAPPRTTWGNSADAIRTGAHATHVTGNARAPAFDCNVCHVKPADALAAGHIDSTSTAELTWGGLAVAGGAAPAWNRAAATCSNTYCHGKFTNGNATNAPVWTGTNQGACGTCHGLPPGGTHPAVGTALTGCATCHPQTMTAAGALIAPSAGGKHLDGIIETSGGTGGHGTSWSDTTSTGFHAYSAIAGISSCEGCHGAGLDGVGGSAKTSCATCHGAAWKTNCVLCHGGAANQTGAPPKGTWGFRTDASRIGAHAKHVTAGAISGAIACATCHVVPADALSAGHLNGSTATVTWGGIAASSGASPVWNRTTGTCASTYCHGGYSGTFVYDFWGPASAPYAGSKATPKWTDAPMTCTSCHGNPTNNGNWHSGLHGGGNNCNLCHPDVDAAGTTITNPALHINGTVEVQAAFKSSCFGCH
jgi:predicted CxxxxCH...CXXCH cytochrome family protein